MSNGNELKAQSWMQVHQVTNKAKRLVPIPSAEPVSEPKTDVQVGGSEFHPWLKGIVCESDLHVKCS